MTAEEQHRFDMLRQGSCVDPDYVAGFYGLSWPLPDDVRPDYEAWLSRFKRARNCGEGCVSRYELESFMQQKAVLPKRWMAARLGMTVASFQQFLNRLKDIGMRPQRYIVYDDLIDTSLTDDVVSNLPGLTFRTFSDHNSFCARLHADLEKTLGLKVEPLYCATSLRLEDYSRQFARDFDCITLEPLSGRHQVWLDFRKWLNLPPDRCSKLFYAENRDALAEFRAGSQDPDDLEQYVQFLASEQHA